MEEEASPLAWLERESDLLMGSLPCRPEGQCTFLDRVAISVIYFSRG